MNSLQVVKQISNQVKQKGHIMDQFLSKTNKNSQGGEQR